MIRDLTIFSRKKKKHPLLGRKPILRAFKPHKSQPNGPIFQINLYQMWMDPPTWEPESELTIAALYASEVRRSCWGGPRPQGIWDLKTPPYPGGTSNPKKKTPEIYFFFHPWKLELKTTHSILYFLRFFCPEPDFFVWPLRLCYPPVNIPQKCGKSIILPTGKP